MSSPDIHLVGGDDDTQQQFRTAMRHLAGGVSIITAGRDTDISGMTVTSLTSLSAAPPRVLVSVNRNASSFALIERHRVFGVNILGSDQENIAKRFSNGKLTGIQRFDGVSWLQGSSGVPLLGGSLASMECQVEEIIERHSHGIIVGSPLRFELSPQLSGLVYWNANYVEVKHKIDLDQLADIDNPLGQAR